MVLFRPVSLMCIVLLMCCAYGLFQVKYRVQNLRRDLAEVNRQLNQERDAIHVLKAEWAYLNQPDRLRKIVAKHLPLEIITISQVQELRSSRMMTASLQQPAPKQVEKRTIEDQIEALLEEKGEAHPAAQPIAATSQKPSRKKSQPVLGKNTEGKKANMEAMVTPTLTPILSSLHANE